LICTAPRAVWVLLFLTAFHGVLREETRLQGQVPDALATVRGRVLENETGVPLQGAAVSLASSPEGTRGIGTRITGRGGDFLFRAVPAGLYRLSVTRVGLTDLRDTLRVEPGADLDLILPLWASPIPLKPIVVVARRSGPLADFEARRRTLSGTFIGREEIEAVNPYVFSDLLRRVPGARVVPTSSTGHRVLLRGGCIPELWVDGTRAGTTSDLDSFLKPSDIEALEVYNGASLPAQFGPNPCGAVVVWTRRGEPVASQNSLLRQLVIAAGFVTLSWLLTR
jgi:hypothetical protein